MRAVVRIDAGPGFEAAVEAAVRRVPGVTAVARQKSGNFDLVVVLEVADEDVLERVLRNDLRMLSGVRGLERVADPEAAAALARELGRA